MVRIMNRKSIFHEFVVDYIVEDWELAVNDNTKSQRKLYGVKEVADLTVSAVVECTGRLLCQNCTEICGEYVLQVPCIVPTQSTAIITDYSYLNLCFPCFKSVHFKRGNSKPSKLQKIKIKNKNVANYYYRYSLPFFWICMGMHG